uniref:Uncharacterized protein n=1 Tax=Spongospora subterranea TaxID=70186 RepID=A0A0H5QRI4_9EUKA|eukprot:CRZ04126.1 hypothetical protein [Spongospora subterranea]
MTTPTDEFSAVPRRGVSRHLLPCCASNGDERKPPMFTVWRCICCHQLDHHHHLHLASPRTLKTRARNSIHFNFSPYTYIQAIDETKHREIIHRFRSRFRSAVVDIILVTYLRIVQCRIGEPMEISIVDDISSWQKSVGIFT